MLGGASLTLPDLPDGLRYFSAPMGNGVSPLQTIFPVMSMTGGLQSSLICMVVEKLPIGNADMGRRGLFERDGGRWYTVEISDEMSDQDIKNEIDKAVTALKA